MEFSNKMFRNIGSLCGSRLQDSEIFINDKKTGTVDTFWNPTPELRQNRLIRFTVPPEEQGEFESERYSRCWQPFILINSDVVLLGVSV